KGVLGSPRVLLSLPESAAQTFGALFCLQVPIVLQQAFTTPPFCFYSSPKNQNRQSISVCNFSIFFQKRCIIFIFLDHFFISLHILHFLITSLPAISYSITPALMDSHISCPHCAHIGL